MELAGQQKQLEVSLWVRRLTALREKLKKAGPLRAAKFTWEASAKQLYAVYQEVCGE